MAKRTYYAIQVTDYAGKTLYYVTKTGARDSLDGARPEDLIGTTKAAAAKKYQVQDLIPWTRLCEIVAIRYV